MESVWTESTLAAYAAGVIDADGSIGIRRNPWQIQVQVFQSLKGEPLVDFLCKHFQAAKGTPYFVVSRHNRQKMIPCYWQGKRALRFLKIIQPFLVFKSAQGEIAIQFQDRLLESHGVPWGEGRKQWAQRQYERMRFLNRKGHEANQVSTCEPDATHDKTLFD